MTEVLSPLPAGPQETETETGKEIEKDTRPTTVFHAPDSFTLKHPLMHPWTLWFTRPSSGRKDENWNDLLKEVVSFDSVEEFWGIYNNISKTSELANKSDYHLFKRGVKPEWEDAQNSHGGKWLFQYKERHSTPIDKLWLHTMLAAIGETVESEEDDEVMGVVVNVRKGFFRIGLWTRTTTNKDALMRIGERFKEVLQVPDGEKVEFVSHQDSAHSGSTRAKTKMTA